MTRNNKIFSEEEHQEIEKIVQAKIRQNSKIINDFDSLFINN